MSFLKYIHREGLGTCKETRPNLISPDEPEVVCLGTASFLKAKEEDVLIVIDSSENSLQKDTSNVAVEAPARRGKRSRKIVFTESDESCDDVKMDVNKSFPDVVKVWYERNMKKETHLRDRVSRYREKMSLQQRKIAKLSKRVRKVNKSSGTVHKGKEAVPKNKVEHEKEMEGLKKELEAMQEKVERERRERVALEESLARVTSERKWLIEEGFEYVVKRLHSSQEYLEPLGAVQTNLWASGAHYGVVAGYARGKDGTGTVEGDPLYKPEAQGEFLKAVHELEHTRFPYLVALSQCADRALDELKELEPKGMEKDDQVDGSVV